MNTYNSLINNLEALELNRIKENIDKFLDMIADGSKTALDALYELTEMEIGFKNEMAITGCVKVANFPYLKEINEFDFSFQPSIDKSKIMDLMTLRFIEKGENVIFPYKLKEELSRQLDRYFDKLPDRLSFVLNRQYFLNNLKKCSEQYLYGLLNNIDQVRKEITENE